MFLIFEIGTVVVECALTHILCDTWFGRRNTSVRSFLCALFSYFMINCGFTLYSVPPIIRTICSVLCVFLFANFAYNTTKVWALVATLINIAINVLIEYLALLVMNILSFDSSQLMQYGLERICYVVIAKLLNAIVILVVVTVFGQKRTNMRIKSSIPLLVCQLISIYICQVFYQSAAQTQEILISYVFVLLGLLYINVTMILYVENLAISSNSKQKAALAEQNFELQKAYYEAVQSDQSKTHALWHDFKKYVLAIEAISSTGNEEAVRENVALIKNTFSQIGNLVDVGNQEVNVILNHCVQKAQMQDIHVMLDVSVPPQLDISAIDLSVIIGNTFDNAIEECQRMLLAERRISVELRHRNGMLLYVIENPCLINPVKKHGLIHGYGLRNVQSCVEKYHGSLITEKECGHFQVSIRLNAATAQ